MTPKQSLFNVLGSGPKEVKMPKGIISGDGITAIGRSLIGWIEANFQGTWFPDVRTPGLEGALRVYSLAGTFSRAWPVIVGNEIKNTKGAFTKRLSKFAWDTYKVKLDSNIMGTVGSLAASNSTGESSYIADVIEGNFDWSAGDFGDNHSCFWSDRKCARSHMENNDFFALRLWTGVIGESLAGDSRCWGFYDDVRIILFNAYSKRNVGLYTMAHIVSSAIGLPYRKIGLCNRGTTDGNLYINSGSGMMIAPQDELKEEWDLGQYVEDDGSSCCSCGDDCGDDYITDHNGDVYCYGCSDECLFCCDECGSYFNRDDRNSVGDARLCNSCLRRGVRSGAVIQCEECSDHFQSDDSRVVESEDSGSETLCDRCADSRESELSDRGYTCNASGVWVRTEQEEA